MFKSDYSQNLGLCSTLCTQITALKCFQLRPGIVSEAKFVHPGSEKHIPRIIHTFRHLASQLSITTPLHWLHWESGLLFSDSCGKFGVICSSWLWNLWKTLALQGSTESYTSMLLHFHSPSKDAKFCYISPGILQIGAVFSRCSYLIPWTESTHSLSRAEALDYKVLILHVSTFNWGLWHSVYTEVCWIVIRSGVYLILETSVEILSIGSSIYLFA